MARSWLIRIPVLAAIAALSFGCSDTPAPTTPTPTPTVCTVTITIGRFDNGSPASPGQGLFWTAYFQTTVLSADASVYAVDVVPSPADCLPSWTAVSANTAAVQVSPAASGSHHLVELFMPANPGPQRSTLVTIAGQTATVTQAGR